jgi:glycine cleavage system protein P-like pyridoxal-binding family
MNSTAAVLLQTEVGNETESKVESEFESNNCSNIRCENPSETELDVIRYLNQTDEERRIRLDIFRMILNSCTVEETKKNNSAYYYKEEMMIWSGHFFHTTHTNTDHSFFSGLISQRSLRLKTMILSVNRN